MNQFVELPVSKMIVNLSKVESMIPKNKNCKQYTFSVGTHLITLVRKDYMYLKDNLLTIKQTI